MEERVNIHDVTLGTGYSIFQESILPAIEKAQSSVILITCFWADSQTRDALNESLLKLSNNALQHGKKIKVRIGFSSCSLFQMLFHTSSPAGRTYDPSEWTNTLGLLSQETLAGIDLEIKSVFFLPFSVWHPKFVIIDQERVFLPSCNVSWEDWFEGCVELSGRIVQDFISFWHERWANESEKKQLTPSESNAGENALPGSYAELEQLHSIHMNDVLCKFLPSPHNLNPQFRLPWQQCASPPKTPLNTQLLELFHAARKEVRLQTPNLTCRPVLDALLDALKRGVDIRILTSEKLMTLEQLVTAGTTTDRCVKSMVKAHKRLLDRRPDEEIGLITPGRLQISYYVPLSVSASGISGGAEPLQSHLKLTIVDNNAIIFGSGNMDRASWYTSQELGVAFFSTGLCVMAQEKLDAAMENRSKLVYDSGKK